MNCRHCHALLEQTFLDLGYAPPSNAYLTAQELTIPELYLPLRAMVCTDCWLVQTADYARPDELFKNDYAYFSSTSLSWLKHAASYAKMITHRLGLDENCMVFEIGSNDGYLLKNFVKAGISCLGFEPTASTAKAAELLGIPVISQFFSEELAEKLACEGKKADLIVGNNVFAHVPDINDFTAGLRTALKDGGVVTLEFPHLMKLIKGLQFDTIYHEHFSYLSLHSVQRILKSSHLRIWDVEELPTHGGSLRVYACHQNDRRQSSKSVANLLEKEDVFGMCRLSTYEHFQEKVNVIKNDFLALLLEQRQAGKTVAAYGAAAKGNTFLNYAGVREDLVVCVYDAAPSKQGKFLPGSHIPILDSAQLKEQKPDIVLILPWNLAEEIVMQHSYIKKWGGKFVTSIPKLVYL